MMKAVGVTPLARISEPAGLSPPGGRGGGPRHDWSCVCELEDVLPYAGVCALVSGRQIAIFRVEGSVFAIDNFDPASEANVLSRGIVGDIKGERVVASPLYKHHYSLVTGRCLEDPTKSVNVYPVRVLDGRLWVNAEVMGIELHSAGDFAGAEDSEALVLRDPRRGVYKRLVIRDNKLREAVLYGDARHGQWYFELMVAGQDITALRDHLLFGPPPAALDCVEAAKTG
jgi:nitrite reductase (NADH) small subunit